MYNFSNVSTLYVSTKNGSSKNAGFLPVSNGLGDGPVKTLEQALAKVQELRQAGMMQPLSVQLMDSCYFLEKTILIHEEISDITIEPFGGQSVTLVGGRPITEFKKSVFRGTECFAAQVPQAADGSWTFTDLYVDGLRADLTRWPEEGVLIPEQVEPQPQELWNGSKWFVAKEGDFPKDIYRPEDMLVSFTHYWIDEHSPVAHFDPATRRVDLACRSRFYVSCEAGKTHCMEYYLENLAEMFQKPNQWYLDRPNGMLYYIPRNKEQTPESIQVYAPTLTTLLSVEGKSAPVRNIRLKNLCFACSRGDHQSPACLSAGESSDPHPEDFRSGDPQAACATAAMLSFSHSYACSVENCVLKDFGLTGILLGDGCQNCRILGCTLLEGGAGGIRVNGSNDLSQPADHTCRNQITDNTILHMGRRYLAGCGILLMDCYENEISHNEIADLFYSGISCGWVWGYGDSISHHNLIEKNHVHHIGQGRLSDMGGIYLLGKQPGTRVTGNLIHDVRARFYGGFAIYTDEGSSFIRIENNLCYNTTEGGFNQHYGCMNVIQNNIFACSDQYLLRMARPEAHLGAVFCRNILYGRNISVYGPDFDELPPRCCASHHNLIFDTAQKNPAFFRFKKEDRVLDLDEIRSLYGLETDSLIADPCFEDAQNHNFSLRPESPAFALGFCPIDLRDVGPRTN